MFKTINLIILSILSCIWFGSFLRLLLSSRHLWFIELGSILLIYNSFFSNSYCFLNWLVQSYSKRFKIALFLVRDDYQGLNGTFRLFGNISERSLKLKSSSFLIYPSNYFILIKAKWLKSRILKNQVFTFCSLLFRLIYE